MNITAQSGSKVQICKCTNCDNYYEDSNPNKQPFFEVDLPSLELMKEGEDFIQACPVCNTDGYLIDVFEYHVIP